MVFVVILVFLLGFGAGVYLALKAMSETKSLQMGTFNVLFLRIVSSIKRKPFLRPVLLEMELAESAQISEGSLRLAPEEPNLPVASMRPVLLWRSDGREPVFNGKSEPLRPKSISIVEYQKVLSASSNIENDRHDLSDKPLDSNEWIEELRGVHERLIRWQSVTNLGPKNEE